MFNSLLNETFTVDQHCLNAYTNRMVWYKNIDGKRYGRLVAKRYAGKSKYVFLCDCGKQKEIGINSVQSSRVRSCGCLQFERNKSGLNRLRHGHTVNKKRSPEHSVWTDMIKRTTNKNNAKYYRYGGRGIKVCDQWKDFEIFLKDMGKRPDGLTLDRIDNDGNYCLENCRWASRKQQARNRRTTRLIFMNGESKSLAEWCEIYKISYWKVKARLDQLHWPVEKAFS